MKPAEARDALVIRIRAEYTEMPGMILRPEQVARLCGVDRTACALVLDALVQAQFLWRRPDGTYARRTGEVGERLRTAKAPLGSIQSALKAS